VPLTDQKEWEVRVSRVLKAELKLAGIGYRELAARLNEYGVKETEDSTNKKLKRGTFWTIFLPLLKSEWVGVRRSVLWARSRAGEARRSEPLTATAGPYNRARLNAAWCGIQPWKQKPVDAEPAV